VLRRSRKEAATTCSLTFRHRSCPPAVAVHPCHGLVQDDLPQIHRVVNRARVVMCPLHHRMGKYNERCYRVCPPSHRAYRLLRNGKHHTYKFALRILVRHICSLVLVATQVQAMVVLSSGHPVPAHSSFGARQRALRQVTMSCNTYFV
jgi:hypothetical protein